MSRRSASLPALVLALLLPAAAPAATPAPGGASPARAETVPADSAPEAAPGVWLVFRDGRRLEVFSYDVDGERVRVVERSGRESTVARAAVDLERSARETADYLQRLNREREEREARALHGSLAAAPGAAAPGRRPTLLFFTAPWCGWCRRLRRESLAEEGVRTALARLDLREVDVDREPELARRHLVTALPALVLLDENGEARKRREGFVPAAELRRWLD